jgi:hypothetical protein
MGISLVCTSLAEKGSREQISTTVFGSVRWGAGALAWKQLSDKTGGVLACHDERPWQTPEGFLIPAGATDDNDQLRSSRDDVRRQDADSDARRVCGLMTRRPWCHPGVTERHWHSADGVKAASTGFTTRRCSGIRIMAERSHGCTVQRGRRGGGSPLLRRQ